MFNKKGVLSLLLLTLISFENLQYSKADERSIITDLLQKAKEIFENVKSLVTNLVGAAIKQLDDLKNRVTTKVSEAIKIAKDQIISKINGAKETIEQIKTQAIKAGKDIEQCLGNVDKLNKLPQSLILDEVQCVSGELQTAQRVITNSIQTVTDIYEAVTHFPKRLEDCLQNPLTTLVCVTGVVTDMLKLEVNAPVQIDKEVRDTLEFVLGLDERLKKCAATQVTIAEDESKKIVEDIQKCASNIIVPLF